MPFTLTMPKLSPTMTSGIIAKWHKREGDQIAPGDVLFEVSTDKATVEHQALDGGWLRKIVAPEGAEVEINQPIAVLTETQEESIESYSPESVKPEKAISSPVHQNAPRKVATPQTQEKSRVAASPLARKLAKEKGLEIATIKGSGPGGRVMSRDLEGLRESIEPGSTVEEPLSPVRKVIARRLQEAKNSIPHFYVKQTVSAEALVSARNQLDNGGVKLTYNDFILRACALALRTYPEVNSGFHPVNQTIIRYQTIDVCVAVSIPEGLITPIISRADQKSLQEISQEVKDLAKRAKEGKLQPSEFQGGSFTVSNLGMYGIDEFIAVINPPQAAILSVGGIRQVPVVKEERIFPGQELSLILSADHRVVDGAAAARFISKVCHYLENPALLFFV